MTRIHVTGASGSGTTTLGAALAARLGAQHLDTDAYYWLPTDPPFREKRPIPDRVALLDADLATAGDFVLSGSIGAWGAPLIARFDLVVFLYVPAEERLARLRARERVRFGALIEPGGPMHDSSRAFLDWATAYDTGTAEGRSLEKHRAWLASLPCRVVEIAGLQSVEERVALTLERLGA